MHEVSFTWSWPHYRPIRSAPRSVIQVGTLIFIVQKPNNNIIIYSYTPNVIICIVTQLQFAIFSEASTIIIKFILDKLDTVADSSRCYLLLALKCLCGVKGGLPVAEQTVLISMLKSISIPEMSKGSNLGAEKDSPKSEIKRSRFDLSSAIMQQLVNPLDISGTSSVWAPLSEEPSDCSVNLNRIYLHLGVFIIIISQIISVRRNTSSN